MLGSKGIQEEQEAQARRNSDDQVYKGWSMENRVMDDTSVFVTSQCALWSSPMCEAPSCKVHNLWEMVQLYLVCFHGSVPLVFVQQLSQRSFCICECKRRKSIGFPPFYSPSSQFQEALESNQTRHTTIPQCTLLQSHKANKHKKWSMHPTRYSSINNTVTITTIEHTYAHCNC